MKLLGKLACAGLLAWCLPLSAFGKCTDYTENARIKPAKARAAANLECATQTEKAGKLADALLFYSVVYGDPCNGEGCDVADGRQEAEAKQGITRLGRQLGAQAENANRYEPGKIFIEGAGGRRAVNTTAGAAAWYEATFNYADTDRAMLKLAQSASTDMKTFERVLDHFRQRERLPMEKGYTLNPAHLKELEKIAAANAEQALAREEKEFKQQGVVTEIADTSHLDRSLAELKRAMDWHAPLRLSNKQIEERAYQRGESLFKDGATPRPLRLAVSYYELAGNQGKIGQVKDMANRLGETAANSGELDKARRYFQIAANDRRAREVGALEEKHAKETGKETVKDKKQQEQFKKEQDKLEKELGL